MVIGKEWNNLLVSEPTDRVRTAHTHERGDMPKTHTHTHKKGAGAQFLHMHEQHVHTHMSW